MVSKWRVKSLKSASHIFFDSNNAVSEEILTESQTVLGFPKIPKFAINVKNLNVNKKHFLFNNYSKTTLYEQYQ